MEEVKDPYNPISDMNILDELQHPKRKRTKKLKVEGDTGMSFRAKMALVFIWCVVAISAITLVGVKTIVSLNQFFDENVFAYHKMVEVKLQAPITIEKREAKVEYIKVKDTNVASKILTQKDKDKFIASLNFPKLVRGVHILESNNGTNSNPKAHHNECNNLGLTNEFGYRALDNYCFTSFEESAKTVDKWFDEQLQTKTLSEALCFYATGKANSTCDYAQNYKALEKSGALALK